MSNDLVKIVSVFDGMSCGQIAISNIVGGGNYKYFASEINKSAMLVTQHNFPETKQIGDITQVSFVNETIKNNSGFSEHVGEVYLFMGGSPCQGFSIAGQQLNFEDERSKLFFDYVRLLKEIKPKFFLLENVKMKKEYEDVITKILGVKPLKINSSLLTAQNRERVYWTNIPVVGMPNDLGLKLRDILEDNPDKKYNLSEKAIDYMSRFRGDKPRWCYHKNPLDGKSACLTANMHKGVPYGVIHELMRFLTPIECERLQGVRDNYTDVVPKTRRYEMLGNGWSVPIIEWILSFIFEYNNQSQIDK